jgi:hypothetical protein
MAEDLDTAGVHGWELVTTNSQNGISCLERPR